MHVVFGLVISGFEVIEQIENLKTDAASRPYADVRVIDCGVLATKSAKDGKSVLRAEGARIQVTLVEDYMISASAREQSIHVAGDPASFGNMLQLS